MTLLVAGLRCEYRDDVPLIDLEQPPRFGWTLESSGRDKRQSAYRIQIASRPGALAEEVGDVWDSGEVLSENTVHVVYAGPALGPGREYDWSVQVRDEVGAWSPWAEPARFRTGLERWSGSWLSPDRLRDFAEDDPADWGEPEALLDMMDPAVYLRREFALDHPVRRATLYGTARGLVEFELNGERVGDVVLAPGWTDYEQRIQYEAHDVTALVCPGDNALGATVAEGWFSGYVGVHRKHWGHLYGANNSLLCELHIELESGGKIVICSDERWTATTAGPIRWADLLHGEHRDARSSIDGWSRTGFDDGAWWVPNAESVDDSQLVPAKSQPARVTAELRPLEIVEIRDGVYVCDFGQNIVGWARLVVEGAAGSSVKLRYAEAVDEAGELYRDNLRGARQTDSFVLRGEGVERFEPRFTYHGFRYVEVTGLERPPEETTVTGCVVNCDIPMTADFSCSSGLVNQLFQNVQWSQRGNFLTVPTDNPQRAERLGWLGDGQLFLPTATLNMDVAAFIAKWADDILDAQAPNGSFTDFAPVGPHPQVGTPGWADGGVIVPWVIYERYGDLRLLERHWPHMERFMDLLLRENPDLLRREGRNFDYADWLAFDEEAPREMLATAYWARCAQLMARIARVLGKRDRAEFHDRLEAGIIRAFNAEYVDEHVVIDGDTQTGYVLALAFGLLPEESRQRAAEHLVGNIERRDWHLATGLHGTAHICRVLSEAGYADVAHRLLEQDTLPSWGYCIRQGATTIWERWDGFTEESGFQTPLMNSFNQYGLGSVGAWIVEAVGGVRTADAAAYRRVVIEPVPGALQHASVRYRSIRGEIVSDWAWEGGGFRLAVTVPPNVEATVAIPALGGELSESGGVAVVAAGVRSVVRQGETWRIEIGSGSYRFESSA